MNRETKLQLLRENMKKAGVNAVIVPSTDPHSSEYVHEHWKSRGWLSGFTGSAGTFVVTEKESGLWTDFRYYIQAADQLGGSDIELYKMGLPDTPSISDFLKDKLEQGDVIGIDGTLFPLLQYEEINRVVSENGITFNKEFDPVSHWEDRPAEPMAAAFELDVKYCGESRVRKIERVRKVMKEKGADSYLISSLADIAWTLNIRGGDVSYTPLVISYLLITAGSVKLFINSKKVSEELRRSLTTDGVDIEAYDSVADHLVKLKKSTSVYYMPEVLNCYLAGIIPDFIEVIRGIDITAEMKCIKNETEIKNIRKAMEKDGAALIKFFKKFRDSKPGDFTEYTLAEPLRTARLEMDNCTDESFDPIIGFCDNGALCHYSAKEDSAHTIGDRGLLLIDSGGQYFEGTTDITRTVTVGTPTDEERLHYTLVLKGHIKLGMAIYPKGTTGPQLDILAREPLWRNGLNFGHGTGHGVGFYLGVHEGPQTISTRQNSVALKEGMVTSNEPGLYIEGKHGIRIENLVLTKHHTDGLDEKFLCFESLTLYPYERDLIDESLLTKDEVEWVNNYHKEVFSRVSPYLKADEVEFLKELTSEI